MTRMVRLAEIVGASSAALRAEPRPAGTAKAGGTDAFPRLVQLLHGVRPLTGGRAFPWSELDELIGALLHALETSSAALWSAAADPGPAGTDSLADHHARTALLALRIGRALGYGAAELRTLGVAACCFDVGRAGERGPGGAGGPPLDREHPRRSAEIVAAWSPPADSIVAVALQHHERRSGQGYPRGLAGDAIHPHAAVVGLADEYVRRTRPPAGPAALPHHAVRDIVRNRDSAFPPAVVKAFLEAVSVFPPGTLVRLNTGERARVVDVNPSHPLRPVVELLADGKGQPLAAPRLVNLAETPFRFVTRPA